MEHSKKFKAGYFRHQWNAVFHLKRKVLEKKMGLAGYVFNSLRRGLERMQRLKNNRSVES